MITTHHVLGTATAASSSLAEFDYQRRNDGTQLATTSFSFEPHVFFYADRDLDYAVVAVRRKWPPMAGRLRISVITSSRRKRERQSPHRRPTSFSTPEAGEPKQVSLRENQIVDVLPNFLHYKADTAPGSSGSAVYNDRWEVVALHHSGVPEKTVDGQLMAVDGKPWRQEMGEDRIKWIANEGVRISRIIRNLREQLSSDAHRTLFEAMLAQTQETQPVVVDPIRRAWRTPDHLTTLAPSGDGSATWTIPLTVSINVGGGLNLGGTGPTAAARPPAPPAVVMPPTPPGLGAAPRPAPRAKAAARMKCSRPLAKHSSSGPMSWACASATCSRMAA